MNTKPLLITGSHRSGSTWIGKVFESSGYFTYIDEPFNLDGSKDRLNGLKYWFEYTGQNTHFIKQLQDKLSCEKIPLFKDPIAFFSVDTFIEALDSNVLISVRHPAAFVSSLKRLGWKHDFNHFLKQEELMETMLYPLREQIIKFSAMEQNIIDQGILLWNIIYLNALKYKQKYDHIYMTTHENLSLDPVNEYRKIFNYFDYEFNDAVIEYIRKTSSAENETEAKNNVVHQLERNSKENIHTYKTRLTSQELNHIRQHTEMIAHCFYDATSWN